MNLSSSLHVSVIPLECWSTESSLSSMIYFWYIEAFCVVLNINKERVLFVILKWYVLCRNFNAEKQS